MEQSKLTYAHDGGLELGDKSLIAKALGCSAEQVVAVLSGVRGKRRTLLQENIKRLASIRAEQNAELLNEGTKLALSA